MCFSAEASFGASAVLGVIGVVAVAKARTTPQRLFAAIPLLFAVQQLAEGMLWLSLKDPGLEPWQHLFTYTFLVFAMMVWPVWIPLTICLLEKEEKRKKITDILLSIGGIVFVGIGCVLWLYRVKVIPAHHHLHYEFDFPAKSTTVIVIFSFLYFGATVITPIVSSIKRMKWLGICFGAAILSFVVLWILASLPKPAVRSKRRSVN
jgi:hypothetical protein